MQLEGTSIIGAARGTRSGASANAINPASGASLEPAYFSPNSDEVERAVDLAAEAALPYGRLSGKEKATFLRAIAEQIIALGGALIERASQETGLPAARIEGERMRTYNQLRLFADLVEEGSWVRARIDLPDPERKPIPKPDVRSMLRPIGPVVVFSASNFPLAFSVAGGDTASALAAGNPVIVKAHSAHPGTSEMVGTAVQKAIAECGLPEGVFSLLYGSGREVGTSLVKHPKVKAVGFTGSRSGGRALMDVAAARNEPIPVYAEMSSINPIFILPGAMKERAEAVATGLHGSITMGVGQFCTNPGIVMMDQASEHRPFTEKLQQLIKETSPGTMLTPGIAQAYREGIEAWVTGGSARELVKGTDTSNSCNGAAALFQTNASNLLSDPHLMDEVFGPASLLVTYESREELLEAARSLEGQLTATLHATEEDLREHEDLLAILETRVGRLLINGFPTGVEVCHAMVHGGPYPATADGRSTSVGTQAIDRFVRPVCFQNFPQSALPPELKDDNPLKILRVINGGYLS